MSNVYGTVFEGAETVPLGDPIQYLTAVIGSTNSDAVTGNNKLRRRVRLFSEAKCWVKWGANPTATGASDAIPLAADVDVYYDIEAGYVITAITRT